MILLYITTALFITYSILILYYRAGWYEIPVFLPEQKTATTRISVIIPARNEEENIGRLLTSMQKQSYPGHLFEVIVVDDHSHDKTADIAGSFSFVKPIRLELENINSYKKKAIETGIAAATGELIVTTDADCIVPVHWLKTIAAFKEEKKAAFIAAPVMLGYKNSFLQIFQSLDFLMLQGITAASVQKKFHNMCNGANLAYERKVFYEVNGFEGIDTIASGDDMLLMHKIARRFPDNFFYLLSKDAIVTTAAAKSWKEFFNQRIRWASKATHYNEIKIFSALALVYFLNLSLLILLVAGFWNPTIWLGFAGGLIAKTIIELFFIYPVAKFFDTSGLLKLFLLFQLVHIIYTVIAGWLGSFGSFEWKGRKVK
jgi:cellulose synthase/poly-beta-1,6-N-acetylglucosamine synthase-like glycosyltransferase